MVPGLFPHEYTHTLFLTFDNQQGRALFAFELIVADNIAMVDRIVGMEVLIKVPKSDNTV